MEKGRKSLLKPLPGWRESAWVRYAKDSGFFISMETGGGKNKWKSPVFSILSMLSGKG